MRWLEIAVPAHVEAVEAVSEILGRVGYNGVAVEMPLDGEGEHVVKAYLLYDRAARHRVRKVRDALGHLQAFGLGPVGRARLSRIENEDWLEHWKASFAPLRIGAFLVCPTWQECESGDATVLKLDPGMAFGTGLHPTTRHCLEALSQMELDARTVLDVGCGSAILAIGAAKRGAARVVGIDVDAIAVREAGANIARNGVEVEVALGSAADVPGTFDVVLANIVAPVLQRIASDLRSRLAPGGTLVAAGIIAEAESATREALGLGLVERRQDGDWVSLVLR